MSINKLPADLPTSWTNRQIIAPEGTAVGLTEQHGYNYLMKQVNASQEAVNELCEIVEEGQGIVDALTIHNTDNQAHVDIRNAVTNTIDTHDRDGDAHGDMRQAIAAFPDVSTMLSAHNGAENAHPHIQTMLSGKADKAKTILLTIPSTGWGNGDVPSQTLQVSGMVKGALWGITLSDTATNAQAIAWSEAGLCNGGEDTDKIILKATGTAPSVNIPAIVGIWG